MIDRTDQHGESGTQSGARPSRVVVVYRCGGKNYTATLDATKVEVIFFDRQRRDEIWESAPPRNDEEVLVLGALDWSGAEDVLIEPPRETDEPAHSGDCFCFEDDMGRRYCVCGMR